MAATYVKYGSYTFPAGLVDVSLTKTARRSPRGTPQTELWRMTLSGTLIADGQAACNTAAQQLEQAFAFDNQTLAVHLGDGTQSVHKLSPDNSISGVRIVQPPSFPTGRDAELATGRSFTLTAEAEYIHAQADGYKSWQESISVRGDGGPEYSLRKVHTGPPQLHQIHAQTPVFVTQQGSAVGFLTYPLAPPPINWGVRLGSQTIGEKASPQFRGALYTDFPIRWSYQFVNTTDNGVPDPSVRP